mmetsp:Transcript_13763/g.55690  ORF Transcript_13763/g.55690 Transcript_13763/m.55690 type:complete len:423 (+) Transcript_13763:551-1819(+)
MQRAGRARLHRARRAGAGVGQIHNHRRPHQRPPRRRHRGLVLQVRHPSAVLQQRPPAHPRHREVRPPRHPPQRRRRGEHRDANRRGKVRKRRGQGGRHPHRRHHARGRRARRRGRHQVQDEGADARRGSAESAFGLRRIRGVHRHLRLLSPAPRGAAHGRRPHGLPGVPRPEAVFRLLRRRRGSAAVLRLPRRSTRRRRRVCQVRALAELPRHAPGPVLRLVPRGSRASGVHQAGGRGATRRVRRSPGSPVGRRTRGAPRRLGARGSAQLGPGRRSGYRVRVRARGRARQVRGKEGCAKGAGDVHDATVPEDRVDPRPVAVLEPHEHGVQEVPGRRAVRLLPGAGATVLEHRREAQDSPPGLRGGPDRDHGDDARAARVRRRRVQQVRAARVAGRREPRQRRRQGAQVAGAGGVRAQARPQG